MSGAKDPEKKRAYDAAWRAAHREERRAYGAAWHAAHREEVLAAKREYYQANRSEIDAAHRRWDASPIGQIKRHRYKLRDRIAHKQRKLGELLNG